jgi:hypothetical protein
MVPERESRQASNQKAVLADWMRKCIYRFLFLFIHFFGGIGV